MAEIAVIPGEGAGDAPVDQPEACVAVVARPAAPPGMMAASREVRCA
jgi:hypothetical protein